MMRIHLFKPVHLKTLVSQKRWALPTAPELLLEMAPPSNTTFVASVHFGAASDTSKTHLADQRTVLAVKFNRSQVPNDLNNRNLAERLQIRECPKP